ncbi:MAG: hypothetical protein ACRD11_12685 [Terriglobia bacterium]
MRLPVMQVGDSEAQSGILRKSTEGRARVEEVGGRSLPLPRVWYNVINVAV